MTEDEWLHPTQAAEVLKYFRSKASDRKKRLFACGMCRRFWKRMEQAGMEAVRMAELYADGIVEAQQLETYHLQASQFAVSHGFSLGHEHLTALRAAIGASNPDANEAVKAAGHEVAKLAAAHLPSGALRQEGRAKDRVVQAGFIRDLLGNPFRPVDIQPAWKTSGVVSVAQTIYEQRAFDQLTALADALEKAGCTNSDVLDHCRQPGEHLKGCWLIDRLLDKE